MDVDQILDELEDLDGSELNQVIAKATELLEEEEAAPLEDLDEDEEDDEDDDFDFGQ